MIKRISPSFEDEKSLGNFSPDKLTQKDDKFDYRYLVIQKPWGHEYMVFQNRDAAVWVLHMKKGAQTSFHCHPNKKTSLTVLAGEVETRTHESKHRLSAGDGLILDKKVFHSTQAITPDWSVVMEVETPTNKQDLFRVDDLYGRRGTRYEGHEYHKVHDDSIHHFHKEDTRYHSPKTIGDCDVMVVRKTSDAEKFFDKINSFQPEVLVVLSGRVFDANDKVLLEAGDSIKTDRIADLQKLKSDENLELLFIKKSKI